MTFHLTSLDRMGLIHPAVDVHTLGLWSLASLLEECGITCHRADPGLCDAVMRLEAVESRIRLLDWIKTQRLTVIGFSYRLDPTDAVHQFGRFTRWLRSNRLRSEQGGPVRALLFAGLPAACHQVREAGLEVDGTFRGGETVNETLAILGLFTEQVPAALRAGSAYDEARLNFGRDLVRRGNYRQTRPVNRSGYSEFGTERDTLVARIRHGVDQGAPPLMRAHVGPYLPDRAAALRLFTEWTRSLAREGLLDVLSIGTSQLSQEDFGGDWEGKRDGGGVPIHTPQQFTEVWQAARPMLVRAYAGTKNVPDMARMFENVLHTAWHALSLWWFCQLDGRGPNDLLTNLREHFAALMYIAGTGKPFEANVSHHFAFRGADDVTYVVASCVAARVAKRLGIRTFILQIMLNTPRQTWGVQDLAKARATLRLVRELEDERFTVILQPRGGLDYFSPEPDMAKVQLAAVTALMDDIEPEDSYSPPIIHVVSYSEGSQLADPAVVNESVRITRQALFDYRALRRRGEIEDMTNNPEVACRTEALLSEARAVLAAIEATIPDPYSVFGLYAMFADGFLPTPYLWKCRNEFTRATNWTTRILGGAVKVVGPDGRPMSVVERMEIVRSNTVAKLA